jgi:hypothetical protein
MLGHKVSVPPQSVACAFDLHDHGMMEEPI